MDINMIGMILGIIIIIAVFIQMIRGKKQVYQKNALEEQVINIFNGHTGTNEQCTYSIWFYVNDWTINYGEEKCIFRCSTNADVIGDLNVYLGSTNNDLTIQIKTSGSDDYTPNYKGYYTTDIPPTECSNDVFKDGISNCNKTFTTDGPTGNYDSFVQDKCNNTSLCNTYSYYIPEASTPVKAHQRFRGSLGAGATNTFAYQLFTNKQTGQLPALVSGHGSKTITSGSYTNCLIEDIELQTWVNLTFSINTNTIDIYINGEMVKSQILNGIASIKNSNSLFISPNGKGFNGFNSKFQYWAYYMNPRQVKNIYKQGSGSSTSSDVRLNISLYKGDERRANIVI